MFLTFSLDFCDQQGKMFFMDISQLTPGSRYRFSISYPGRFIKTNRGKMIEWSSGFTGEFEGVFLERQDRRREAFDPSKVTYANIPILDEWDYWNDATINPEIHRFWDWGKFLRKDGVVVEYPLSFITQISKYLGYEQI